MSQDWWCPTCGESVSGGHVTYYELHDPRFGGCGNKVLADKPDPTAPTAEEAIALVEEAARNCRPGSIGRAKYELAAALARNGQQLRKAWGRILPDVRNITDDPFADE